MKSLKSMVGVALLGATLGLTTAPATAVDGILFKVDAGNGYCHLKFAPTDENTLDRPVRLEDTTDIIDFYGPCDYDPKGAEEVHRHRIDVQIGHEVDGYE